MEPSKSASINFYRNLGKLFYAIAAADRNVRDEEYNTLKDIVKADWLSVDDIEDSFGTDTAYHIEIVFNWLRNEDDNNAHDCFDNFIAYKKKNEYLFSDNIKQLIMKTATAIASSFSEKNKSELIMLANFNIQLYQTQ